QFVGADRGLKRLALTRVAELKLIEPNGRRASEDAARRVGRETSVRDALSALLIAGGEPLTVIDDQGGIEGLVTLGLVEQLLSDEIDGAVPEPVATSVSSDARSATGDAGEADA
ncbi:MAG TPA: hypothetical protein VH025_06200, partial [Solirubrobacteraceae bacterium]|nr:hypothetical protein [Solirubrobacteraceae bacterium]